MVAALALAAAPGCGGGGDDAGDRPAPTQPTVQVRATAGDASRLLGPSSTCGSGAPEDVRLACGIRAARRRTNPLPVAGGGRIALRFEADVDRLLVQLKRASPSGPVEVTQLMPVPAPDDRRSWTVPAPPSLPAGAVLGLVALYDEVHIRRLTTGGLVALRDAVVQFQLPLEAAR